jgi:hypothetical protein
LGLNDALHVAAEMCIFEEFGNNVKLNIFYAAKHLVENF